jgi:hypothetical protein
MRLNVFIIAVFFTFRLSFFTQKGPLSINAFFYPFGAKNGVYTEGSLFHVRFDNFFKICQIFKHQVLQ